MKKLLFSKRYISLILIIEIISCILFGCAIDNGEEEEKASGIVISEAVTSNKDSLLVEDIGSPDWIELYNPTENEISLKGYMVYRADKKEDALRFDDVTLPSGGRIVVLCTEFLGDETSGNIVSGFRLPKGGTTVILKNEQGRTIDQMKVPALETDISYVRTPSGYKYCLAPTPGREDQGLLFDSYDEIKRLKAPEGLVINEASKTFLEIYNSSDKPVQMAYFTVSDSKSRLGRWRFPSVELGSGEYYVIYFGSDGLEGPDFSISAYESDIFLSFNGEIKESVNVAGLLKNMSVGLNDKGEKVFFADITPGEQNSSIYSNSTSITDVEMMSVHINEVMDDNDNSLIDEFGDRPSWVEIYNDSDVDVDMEGLFLSDKADDPFKFRLKEGTLPAHGYKVIYLSGKDVGDHASFKLGKGETLYLTDYRTLERQAVLFPDESRLSNVSYGLKDGKWLFFMESTPGKENTTQGYEDIKNAEKLSRLTPFISEVVSVNEPRSGKADWIELYNPTEKTYSLEGLYLSDDYKDLKKFALSGTIAPKGYKALDTSNSPSKQKQGTGTFSISPSGETIYLTDGIKLYDVFETGVLKVGYSSGRVEDDPSGERVFFSSQTKGAKNSGTLKPELNAREFSHRGGVVSGEFTLEISGEGNIYYTTDGTRPSKSSNLYTGPMKISGTTVINAVCIKDGHIPSDTNTVTFLFEKAHTVPVVCITADPQEFKEVYAVRERLVKVERKCNIEFYEADGTKGVSFPAGIRVSGNSTRVYAQKSFSIYLRSGYGKSSVTYPFFDDYEITSFQSLVLRNGGQDWKYTRVIDAYTGVLFKDLNIDTSMSRPVVVYVNGKYYGIYDLKESMNENCLASQHGVEEDNLNVIRRNFAILAGDTVQIKQIYQMAKTMNMAVESNYEKFCKYVDADAWIDYIIARSFTGDYDMFNQKLWNEKHYEVKWRPIFYDFDFAFRGTQASTLNRYFTGAGVASPDGSLTNMYIPTALKQNAGWREKFLKRASEVLKDIAARSLDLFDSMVEEIRPEMQRHIARWGGSYSEWQQNCKTTRAVIAARPRVLVKQIQNVFGVSAERIRELFPDFV